MALDSKAHFPGCLAALGFADLQSKFEEIGCTTMAEFAFSAKYIPGEQDDTVFLEEIVVPLTGDQASRRKAALRRLFFECYTNAANDINRRASCPDDDEKLKKVPAPEREDRFDKLKERLSPGLTLKNELEPSTVLINTSVEMEELGELRYLKWEEFAKHSQEKPWSEEGPMLFRRQRGKAQEVPSSLRIDHQHCLQ